MVRHQSEEATRAHFLIIVDIADPHFLFGKRLFELYGGHVYAIDHHGSLHNFLENPDLFPEEDLELNRVEKVMLTPSTTCAAKFLYFLLKDEFATVYSQAQMRHFVEWTVIVNNCDTLGYRDRTIDDFAYKTGFHNYVLKRKVNKYMRNTCQMLFILPSKSIIDVGMAETSKNIERVKRRVQEKLPFECVLDGKRYSGYYWVGYDWSMSWLSSELSIAAYHDKIGRIGIGVRPHKKKDEYKLSLRMLDLKEGEPYLTEIGDNEDISLAEMTGLLGGGGHKYAAGLKIIGKEKLK